MAIIIIITIVIIFVTDVLIIIIRMAIDTNSDSLFITNYVGIRQCNMH